MKNRILCFLTAMILTLLLCVPASASCPHDPSGYILDVVEEADVGKAGYGILSCPICNEVINDHFDLPALLDPFNNDPLDPKNNIPANPDDPNTPDTPGTPDTPADPNNPNNPDTPAQPDNPDRPAVPEQPLTPDTPQTPDSPDTPAGSETPGDPEIPVILPGKDDNDQPGEDPQSEVPVIPPEQPVQPETPAEPEQPVQPAQPVQPETPAQQEEPVLPAVQEPSDVPAAPEEELPAVPVPEPGEPEAADETSGGGTGSAGSFRRPRFSKDYPYRRIKMKPEENIRAEAAGTLIWPVAASPFQKILNH